MANGSAFKEAVEISKDNPALRVGIHLSLVGAKAVAEKQKLGKLIDSLEYLPQSYQAFLASYYFKKFSIDNIATETSAQIEKVLESGIRAAHIDSHQHVHILPAIFTEVCKLAKQHNISNIRIPLDTSGIYSNVSAIRKIQIKVLLNMSNKCKVIADDYQINYPNNFLGLGVSGELTKDYILKILTKLKPGINELMCHPGFVDDYTKQHYKWGYNWDQEVKALTDPEVINKIKEMGIYLIS